jgi:hypothetical protein
MEKVAVRGLDEKVATGVDPCHFQSRYDLFQRIAGLANAAAVHFGIQVNPLALTIQQ